MNNSIIHEEPTNLELSKLDTAWITDFTKLETEYNDFYQEMPKTARVYNLYINKNNCLLV